MSAPVIQFKRGLFSNLPGLRAGEPGFTTDKYDLYVGVNSTSEGNKFFGSHRYWTKETSTTGSGVNLVEGTNNGENAITLKAPAALENSYTITFPSAIVNNGYLKVASDGTLSWDAQVDSENIVVTGIATIAQLKATTATVGAGLTVSGDADLNGNLDVDGFTELDAVNISETLSVTGVSTFTGNIDANGNLDVDGFTELDAVNISETLSVTGVSTFTGAIDANGGANISGSATIDQVSVTGVVTASSFVGEGSNVTNLTYNNIVGVQTAVRSEFSATSSDFGRLTYNSSTGVFDVAGITTSEIRNQFSAGTGVSITSGQVSIGQPVATTDNVTFNDIRSTGIVTATSFATGASGAAIGINTNTISGPATITIDPAAVGDNTGLVVIKGDLQIDGTTTTINSTTVSVDDLNILLADGAVNDAAANGGGITVQSGEGNKTFQFEASGDNFGSSENMNLASGKVYKINNTEVLSSNTLGSGVTSSSLTSVGTLGQLTVSGVTTSSGGFSGNLTGNVTGNADTATALQTGRDFSISGDATASAISFNGTANVGLALTLANTGVTTGSYGSSTQIPTFTVDAKGRLTAAGTAPVGAALTVTGDSGSETINFLSENLAISGGTNLTSSAAANAVTIDLDPNISLTSVVASGVITATSGFSGNLTGEVNSAAFDTNPHGVVVTGVATATSGFSGNLTGNVTGNADTATALDNARDFSISGDATASAVSFDGTANVGLALTLANTGVTTGSYGSSTQIPTFTVDAKGRLTAAGTAPVGAALTVAGDSGTETINFLSENLTISGGTNLTSSAASNTVTVNLDDNISLTSVVASGIVTATSFATGASGSAIIVNSNTITGPSSITIDPSAVGDATGTVYILGDLQVKGTQTVIDSTTVTVEDLNITLANGAANDAAANGGGITVQSGEGSKTFQFEATGDNFGSSENVNLASGKVYKINNLEVLSATGLSTNVTVNAVSLDIDGATAATALTSDDLFLIDDGASGNNKKLTAQQLSNYVLGGSGGATFAAINVTGLGTIAQLQATTATVGAGLTVSGDTDLNGNLDVDGFTELDAVNISETLSVTGVSTFTGNIDANSNLDVAGGITGNFNATGVSTAAFLQATTVNASGIVTASSFVGNDIRKSDGALIPLVGVSTASAFTGLVTAFKFVGTGLENFSVVNGVAEVSYSGVAASTYTTSNTFTATQGQTSFNFAPGYVDGFVDVYLNGIRLITGVDFTANDGTNVVLSSGATVGDELEVVSFKELGDLIYVQNLSIVDNLNAGIVTATGSFNGNFNATGVSTAAFLQATTINASGIVTASAFYGSGAGLSAGTVPVSALDIDGATAATALTSDDLFLIDDGANGTNKKLTAQQLSNYVLGGSGGATFAAINVTGIGTIVDLKATTATVGAGLTVSGDTDLNGNLDVDGFTELDAVNISETLSVTGVSTFTGNIDANGNLDVDGFTELDAVNISETLSVTGVSTFTGNIDANGDLDVAGGITGNFNATGVSTAAFLQATTVNASGIITASSFVGNLTGNSSTATALQNARDIQVTGDASSATVSFNGTANVGLAVTLATVNSNVGQYGSQTTIPVITVNAKGLVTAVTTASVGTALTVTGDSGTENIDLLTEALSISGGTNVTTSASTNGVTVNLDNDISLTSVVASGIITATSGFSGNLTGNVTGNVSGNLNSVGVSTISYLKADTATVGAGLTVTGATDLNGGLDVSGGETVLSSATVSDLTSGRIVLAGASGALVDSGNLTFGANGLIVTGGANVSAASTFGSNVSIGGSVIISGDLTVNGTTTQINTIQMTVEDTLIELQMVDGSAPGTDTNKDVGVVMNYFDSSAKKAAFYWDDSAGRMVAASQVSESSGVLTASTFAGLEIGSLYLNDCAGASQVISCSNGVRSLENITIDGGLF